MINNLKNYPLSSSDIINKLGGRTKIVLYSDLKKYNNIDQLLNPYGNFVILYRIAPTFGHWCCVFRMNNKELEFFDSYGTFIDDELNKINKKTNMLLGQDKKYLSNLLYNSPYQIYYNQYKFQSNDADIATCGRWVILRIMLSDIKLDDFAKMFKNKNADDIVTYITS